jgi:oligogalacturonide lyase
MPKGQRWPAEWRTYEDRSSGTTVRQLTDHMAHSYHLYFTNPGWYDGGRKLLFGSDRGNTTNLYGLDLESGEITQLTDWDPVPQPRQICFLQASVNPVRDEAYAWRDRSLIAIDLHTLEERELWQSDPAFIRSMTNCTADGKRVCAGVFEDMSDRFAIDYLHGYVGFHETWQARPKSRIMSVDVDSGAAEVVWEENNWIGH